MLGFAFMTNRHWQIHTTLPSLIALMELIFICVPLITWKLHTFYAWHILHSFSKRLWWERGEKAFISFFFPFHSSNWSSSRQSILLYGPTFLHYCCNQVAAERHCTQKNMVEIFRCFFFFFTPLNRWDLGCPCFPTMVLRCFLSPHSRCCLNVKLFTLTRGIALLSILMNLLFLMETALHL